MEEILIPLGAFAMVVLIVYFGVSRRHSERVELIKRGINPEKYDIKLPGRLGLPSGVILLALGVGFFVPTMIIGDWNDANEIGWSLACIIAGVGLIIYWKITASDRERALKLKEELILRDGPDFEPDRKPEE